MIARKFENRVVDNANDFLGEGNFHIRHFVCIADDIVVYPPAPEFAQALIMKFFRERLPTTVRAKYFRSRKNSVGVPSFDELGDVLDKIIGIKIEQMTVSLK